MVNYKDKNTKKELSEDVLAAIKGAEGLIARYESLQLKSSDSSVNRWRLGLGVQYSHNFAHILDQHRCHPDVAPVVRYFAENNISL